MWPQLHILLQRIGIRRRKKTVHVRHLLYYDIIREIPIATQERIYMHSLSVQGILILCHKSTLSWTTFFPLFSLFLLFISHSMVTKVGITFVNIDYLFFVFNREIILECEIEFLYHSRKRISEFLCVCELLIWKESHHFFSRPFLYSVYFLFFSLIK